MGRQEIAVLGLLVALMLAATYSVGLHAGHYVLPRAAGSR